MHLLVTYDIISDKRRTKLAKALTGFLNRVQKSVFEGEIPDHRLDQLYQVIEKAIDQHHDSVRLYRLCGRCQTAIEVIGRGEYIGEEEDEVV